MYLFNWKRFCNCVNECCLLSVLEKFWRGLWVLLFGICGRRLKALWHTMAITWMSSFHKRRRFTLVRPIYMLPKWLCVRLWTSQLVAKAPALDTVNINHSQIPINNFTINPPELKVSLFHWFRFRLCFFFMFFQSYFQSLLEEKNKLEYSPRRMWISLWR